MTVPLPVIYLAGFVVGMRVMIGPIMRAMDMDRDDPVDRGFAVVFAGLASLLWPVVIPFALVGLWALGPRERTDR